MDTLTLRQTAEKIGVHRNTLRKYMRTGMPYLRCPGARKIQFVWSEVETWLRAESERAKAAAEVQTVVGRLRAFVARKPKPPKRTERIKRGRAKMRIVGLGGSSKMVRR